MANTAIPPRMLAVKKTGGEQAELIEVPVPQLDVEDVLIRVQACSICASDLPGWIEAELAGETPGKWNPNNPGLTGHEIAGDIAAVGSRTLDDRLGERVWIDAITGCGECDECAEGRQTFCPRVTEVCQGFAEYVAAPARQCRRIPSYFSYATASLIFDMAGTPLGAVKRANIRPGESVGVWGLGPVGAGMVQGARIAQASPIIGLDPLPARRARAESLGATLTIDPTSPDALEAVRNATGGKGPHVVLNSVAHDAGAHQAFEALRLDGRMVTVSGSPPAGRGKPKWVSGSWGCFERDWPEVLSYLESGRFELESYVTHTFSLDQIEEAFRVRLHDPDASFKVVVAPVRDRM